MAQAKRKNQKRKKVNKKQIISAQRLTPVKWFLLFFALCVTAVLAHFIVTSFAAGGQTAVPHLVKPNASTNYTVAAGAKQPVMFVVYFTGSARSGVQFQAAYHLKGSPVGSAWTTLASNPAAILPGPNGVNMVLNSSYVKGNLIDQNGLICSMGYGNNSPPKSCTDTWRNSRMSGTAVFNNYKAYFPHVTLPVGTYEWTTRTYNMSTKQYSGWARPATFTIKDSTKVVRANPISAIVQPIVNIVNPPATTQKNITIMTFGYSFAGPGGGFKYVANVLNGGGGIKAIPSLDFSPSQNGTQASVRNKVMATSEAQYDLQYIKANWTPNLKNGDKIAIGCSRGHHRSVSLAITYGLWLQSQGWHVTYNHRDINKSY